MRSRVPVCATALALAAVASGAPVPADAPALTEITAEAGLRFRHVAGHTTQKFMIETIGSGVCFLDYDGDGLPDLYFVQSGPVPGQPGATVGNALYRNLGGGRFEDVTAAAGVGDTGYGMGCAAADVDGDGDTDLYVSNFGPNVLYRNEGDGRFRDVTDGAGVGNRFWGASAAFADYDGDGDADLYVTNYLDFTVETNKVCGDHTRHIRAYCHPNSYEGAPDALYRNRGDGTFEDVTIEAGVTQRYGKGLGVVWSDLDDDGWLDLYVANDSVPNTLYRNLGDGTFEDVTLLSGTGYSEDGRPEAGMGTDTGDLDGDGRLDLVVTNLSGEVNEIYRNLGGMQFDVITYPIGFGEISLSFVGFGVNFFDYDNDGDQDVLVVNGHVLDNIWILNDSYTFAQRDFLFENAGAEGLREVGRQRGDYFSAEKVGRGLAHADVDGDGDLDIAISNSDEAGALLRNDGGNGKRWLRLRLTGSTANPDALGARAIVTAGGVRLVDEVQSGTSYCSQNDLALHFGLGDATDPVAVEVRWPNGGTLMLRGLQDGRLYRVREADGAAGKRAGLPAGPTSPVPISGAAPPAASGTAGSPP